MCAVRAVETTASSDRPSRTENVRVLVVDEQRPVTDAFGPGQLQGACMGPWA